MEHETQSSEARFAGYVDSLAAVPGREDRARPLKDYCAGRLMPGERKSVEPMAVVVAPAHVTTSMGRLTLNMLLSFAQFEREITGERIRDKVAASKSKGVWRGGAVPFGYRVENRALHVVEDQAGFVRDLFRRYLKVGSVARRRVVLDSENVRLPVLSPI